MGNILNFASFGAWLRACAFSVEDEHANFMAKAACTFCNHVSLVTAGFAAQSLLAALGSVQFVSNVFFASFVLKEQV